MLWVSIDTSPDGGVYIPLPYAHYWLDECGSPEYEEGYPRITPIVGIEPEDLEGLTFAEMVRKMIGG